MRSPKAGVVIHNNSKKLLPWRTQVADAARKAWGGKPLIDAPVFLTCEFMFPRPARRKKSPWRDTAPDLDKLIRAVGDALQGVVVVNDSRIVWVLATKVWADEEEPGVLITLGGA